MTEILSLCPGPPHWRVDWDALVEQFEWIRALQECPQDPEHHAEGNVAEHTRLVLESLASKESFRALSDSERQVTYLAALLHDLAKPETTIVDTAGRITSPGHAPKGAIRARRILWGLEVPFSLRESVTAIIAHHSVPLFLLEREDPKRTAIRTSQTARCDLLALIAQADVLGRKCDDQAELLDNVALFREACIEYGCWQRPFKFASDHSRFQYFRTPGRSADYRAYDDFNCEVTVLSGLPGVGKDHWLKSQQTELPVISLDEIRHSMGVNPTERQGTVVQAAKQKARELFRKRGNFVWNATNISRDIRRTIVSLAADYEAHVKIVYLEVPEGRQRRQNRQRTDAVPEPVIDKLLRRWQVPDLTEAHQVDLVVDDT